VPADALGVGHLMAGPLGEAVVPLEGGCLRRGMRGESLARVTGLPNVAGSARPVVVHGVQHLLHPPAMLADLPQGHDRKSRLVRMLHNLRRAVVERGFRAFVVATQENATIPTG
jgi:G3E family GTPase